MDGEIIGAIITAVGTISAVVLGWWLQKKDQATANATGGVAVTWWTRSRKRWVMATLGLLLVAWSPTIVGVFRDKPPAIVPAPALVMYQTAPVQSDGGRLSHQYFAIPVVIGNASDEDRRPTLESAHVLSQDQRYKLEIVSTLQEPAFGTSGLLIQGLSIKAPLSQELLLPRMLVEPIEPHTIRAGVVLLRTMQLRDSVLGNASVVVEFGDDKGGKYSMTTPKLTLGITVKAPIVQQKNMP